MTKQNKIFEEHKDERQPCETYSRVVGYLRPINQWNDGKQEEFKLRTRYDEVEKKEKQDD